MNKEKPSNDKSQPKIIPPSPPSKGSEGQKWEIFSLDSPSFKDKSETPKGGE